VIKDLAAGGVRALLVGGEPPDPNLVRVAREAGLPLIPAEPLSPVLRGKTGVVGSLALDEAIAAWKEEQKEFLREREAERVEYLVREYRSEREKEVRRGG